MADCHGSSPLRLAAADSLREVQHRTGISVPYQYVEVIGGHWMSEVVALAMVTTERIEFVALLAGFDPLGHHRHTQSVGQFDDGGNDDMGRRFLVHGCDERLIDLDDVDRERSR